MKQLKDILGHIEVTEVVGSEDVEINSLVLDSRQAGPGSLFAAISGTQTDGHKFIDKAIENGATVVLCEHLPKEMKNAEGVTFIVVEDSARAFGLAASAFYDFPSEKLRLVGITGTNGKTTTATLLHQLFTGLGYKAGLISTVENRVAQRVIPATHTTPDAASINLLIHQMVEAGCDYVFMEVSSHAVVQQRIAGLTFAGGVFTNITHEHLDYHKTFKAYIAAKKKFFDDLPETAFALVNIDDKHGQVMVQNTRATVKTLALRRPADFKARILDNSLEGLHLDLDGVELHARLIGAFNAYNLLTAYAVAMLLGQEKEEVLPVLSNLRGAEGRFEKVKNQETGVLGIVDYAHTPDALEKVLSTIHQLNKGKGKVITVVGAGGDRDRSKRPLMAKVAANYSDTVILTSDNPRSEEPEAIIEEMKAGLPPVAKTVLSIVNRREAIKTAAALAGKGDIILVAGKGHEKYQEIKGVKTPFDDVRELTEALGISKTF
ncbi:MAG: UDP-N-acetylmuramoyl-L-alanyl-D-glutamate--2,6-diaminopimelate ligase [Bacteroidetes bacterium]|nr:MAG: UDP-N-acetylmuramoyl-L-alanyl-D-glutamate--2,6-diaminopimelate ligase [Bacteroidota bacterium]